MFPLFISIFHCSFSFSVHSPVSDSCTHVSGLLSVHLLLCISCVLVLDCSGLSPCVIVLLFWQFTLAMELCLVITCSLLPYSRLVWPSCFTCICFHLLLVVFFHFLFSQPCLLSSSPVLGSTSHCPITQFPHPSIHLPSGVHSFGSTPPSQDIVSIVDCCGSPSLKVYLIIKSSGIQTLVLSQTSIHSSQTFIPLSWTSIPIDVAQYLTVS